MPYRDDSDFIDFDKIEEKESDDYLDPFNEELDFDEEKEDEYSY